MLSYFHSHSGNLLEKGRRAKAEVGQGASENRGRKETVRNFSDV